MVLSGIVPPHLPQRHRMALELHVRVLHGRLTCGPARLVSPSGTLLDILVLGTWYYDGQPALGDPPVISVGIEGVALSDIEVGQMLIQEHEQA